MVISKSCLSHQDKHTLITTRNQHAEHIPAEGFEVGVYDVNDATELLLTRSQVGSVDETQDGRAEAMAIVKELGCLPLAIEQAAAYIREASKDLFKFLPSYRKNRRTHHSRASTAIRMYYKESVATTWHLSFRRIEENNSDAFKLLRLLAFLNPDGILVDFLEAGKDGLKDDLQAIVADSDRLYEALGELERFSLIKRQNDEVLGQKITIHRLVQSIIKDEMPVDLFSDKEIELIGLCYAAFPGWHNWQTETLLRSRRYQDQVILPLLSIQGIQSQKLEDVLERVGVFLREDGKYQQARELLTKAVDIMNEIGGSDDPDTLRAMANLASTYWNQGRWDDAVKLEEKVLEARIRLLSEEHPDTLTAMANLASTYWNQGRWDDAVKLEEKVLEARIRLLGEEHPDTLTAMANLASTYRNQGRWDDAVKLEEKVLEARIRLLGEEHPDTLTAMANLASTYWNQGRWDDAVKLQEKVLETRIRLLGEEHPDTLTAMANLASTYRNQGRWDDAVKLQEKVLEARIRLLGEEHPDTLTAMANLASTYRNQGRWDDAVKLEEKVLETRIRLLGEEHPDTLTAMANLASTYRNQGRWDDAVKLQEKVLEARIRLLGRSIPTR